jgi:hypothetical protein
MDHELLAHPLATDDEAGSTVRAESDHRANDLIWLDAGTNERRGRKRLWDTTVRRQAHASPRSRERETSDTGSCLKDLASRE